MAHRDGATGAAETVAGPADAAGRDGDVVVGPAPANGPTSSADGDVPVTDGGHTGSGADPSGSAEGRPGEAAGQPPTTPPTGSPATPAARRGRLPRPAGPWTPSFGLSLAAIRGQRSQPEPEETAELRRSLADQEAQTNELREALDALRQALDDTTSAPPRPPAGADERPRRRRGLLLTLLAFLVVAGVVAAFVVTRDGGPTVVAPVPATSASSGVAPSASASAPLVPPSASATPTAEPQVTTAPLPWRDGPVDVPPGIPVTGPGVDAAGTDVAFAIDRDLKHIDVYERYVATTPADVVALSLPDVSVWRDGLSIARPVVEDLQVEIDGVPVRAQQEGKGWFARPAVVGRARSVVLRYRLSGVVVHLPASVSKERMLVAVPSLTARTSLEAGTPTTFRIDDTRVLSVSCLTPKETVNCGVQSGTTWVGSLPAGASPVAVLSADFRRL